MNTIHWSFGSFGCAMMFLGDRCEGGKLWPRSVVRPPIGRSEGGRGGTVAVPGDGPPTSKLVGPRVSEDVRVCAMRSTEMKVSIRTLAHPLVSQCGLHDSVPMIRIRNSMRLLAPVEIHIGSSLHVATSNGRHGKDAIPTAGA